MHPLLRKGVKTVLHHAPAPVRHYFFPKFQYNFSAPQLCFLCRCLEETRAVPGAIAEIGCASGATTLFLNSYMNAERIEKDYYALDTFSGFVAEDIAHEVHTRGKQAHRYRVFGDNDIAWFEKTMRLNGIRRVRAIQADVNAYDLTSLGPLAFALFDVDLYRPMKKGLPELYDALSPGGILVVDDCDPANERWDGADQAYKEFAAERGLPLEVRYGKLGVLRKPV